MSTTLQILAVIAVFACSAAYFIGRIHGYTQASRKLPSVQQYQDLHDQLEAMRNGALRRHLDQPSSTALHMKP